MEITTAFADPDLELDGVWLDYRDGSRVKVARLGNPRFQKLYDAKMKPFRRLQRQNRLDGETENRVLCECLAGAILRDWRGFTKFDEELAYSTKAALDLLLASIDFRNEITDLASAEESFHQGHEQDSEGNS